MNKLVTLNPYRLLGVYSNSPTKDKVANMSKLKAFLKVGRPVSYQLDLEGVLPPIERTEQIVAAADAKLTLPVDQLKQAQFWFMKDGQFDEIAFNHLFDGDMSKAIEIWNKKDTASSLQNRIVCALINEDYATACSCADKLYSQFTDSFVSAVAGGNIATNNLAYDFLDSLAEEVGVNELLPHIFNNDWRQHLSSAAIKPIIEKIQSAIEVAKGSRGKGPTARYQAGVKLMNGTKSWISQLQKLLPKTDLQYQMVADKLASEILQCGIDYYNESKDDDAAQKAMKLQKYAKSKAVGTMVKQRCKENVEILEKIISELPPTQVMAEDRAIKEELRKFCNLPDKIAHSVTLLNNTKPYLQTIRGKLGATNDYYLKTSTMIVGNALHNIIAEVNEVQEEPMMDVGGQKIPMSVLLGEASRQEKLRSIKDALQRAWNATRIMDTFDMEPGFKTQQYDKNRSILRDLCNQVGINTTSFIPRATTSQPQYPTANVFKPRTSTTPRTPSGSSTRPSTSSSPSRPSSSSSSSSSSSDDINWGCVIPIAIFIIMFLVNMCDK